MRAPLLSALFLIPALSLAGIPPLSGFWAKLGLIEAGFLGGQNTIVIVALLTSLLTLVSMMKIWNEVFWKPAPQDAPEPAEPMAPGQWAARFIPIALLAGLTVLIGLFPAPLLTWPAARPTACSTRRPLLPSTARRSRLRPTIEARHAMIIPAANLCSPDQRRHCPRRLEPDLRLAIGYAVLWWMSPILGKSRAYAAALIDSPGFSRGNWCTHRARRTRRGNAQDLSPSGHRGRSLMPKPTPRSSGLHQSHAGNSGHRRV